MLHRFTSQIQSHCFLEEEENKTEQISVLTGVLLMHTENLIYQIIYLRSYIEQLGMLLLVG